MNFWYRSLPICLLIMIGFNMRSALTSVPPILTDLKTALELPSWLLGSLTTIPLLCFAFAFCSALVSALQITAGFVCCHGDLRPWDLAADL